MRKKIDDTTIELIYKLSDEKGLGRTRIRRTLEERGIKVGESTIGAYLTARKGGFVSIGEMYHKRITKRTNPDTGKTFESMYEYHNWLAKQNRHKNRGGYLDFRATTRGRKNYCDLENHLAREQGFKSTWHRFIARRSLKHLIRNGSWKDKKQTLLRHLYREINSAQDLPSLEREKLHVWLKSLPEEGRDLVARMTYDLLRKKGLKPSKLPRLS